MLATGGIAIHPRFGERPFFIRAAFQGKAQPDATAARFRETWLREGEITVLKADAVLLERTVPPLCEGLELARGTLNQASKE